jgi:hypothetical protein
MAMALQWQVAARLPTKSRWNACFAQAMCWAAEVVAHINSFRKERA